MIIRVKALWNNGEGPVNIERDIDWPQFVPIPKEGDFVRLSETQMHRVGSRVLSPEAPFAELGIAAVIRGKEMPDGWTVLGPIDED